MVLMILHERWVICVFKISILSCPLTQKDLYCLRIWTAAYPQKKWLGSSELSCAEEYMKDCVTGGSAAGSVGLLPPFFFLTCLFLLGFILHNIPEVFMTKILCTWLLTLEKSLFLKRPLDGWHGWPQRQGRISFRNQSKKTWKRELKGKGKGSLNMLYIGLLSSHFICTG